MVNENKGLVYEPRPFYNRKLVRTVLRNMAYKQSHSKVNHRMRRAFYKLRYSTTED